VLAECAVRALRLEDIESRVCARLQDALMILTNWTPEVIVVSPSFAWQLGDTVQDRIRKLGVGHILMFSQQEGFVEMSPPTHIEPLLAVTEKTVPNGSRVLLVEDDPEYGSVVEFEMAQAGYIVERAYDGLSAVESISKRPPQMIVLDLALPQLDGFGVLEEMRKQSIMVPTIVLTALDDPTLEERLRELGAHAVFRKFELILAAGEQNAAQVKAILTPVLAANPSEVSREAGLLSGNA
jgi:CheY-like chemotaxis protein